MKEKKYDLSELKNRYFIHIILRFRTDSDLVYVFLFKIRKFF